jgi:hypothetical protein
VTQSHSAWLFLSGLIVLGCASAPRFRDQPPVWIADDQRDIPAPRKRPFVIAAYLADTLVFRQVEQALELPASRPALDVNALDEVPNSTWFQNRIGRFDLSAAEVIAGSNVEGPPELPLTVRSSKNGGGNPGFVASDGRGKRYVIKFDSRENPELQSGADAIVSRFLWAIGYNVPEDYVFNFRRSDLRLAASAKFVNAVGKSAHFSSQDLDVLLKNVPRASNGTIRASASAWVAGVPKGGFAVSGTRPDDPNDVIPHERRRVLRGLRVFSAWLDHTDVKEDNTLDSYVEERGRHFLRHYLVDFGEALGGHAVEKGRAEDGFEHWWDWQAQPRALVTFGLWKRPWEDRPAPPYPSVGSLVTRDFDPSAWREAYPFQPFSELDRADAFWAAKIIMRFDRKLVEAIVSSGKLSDPRAAGYLVEALLARRAAIGRRYLETVTPLDDFHAEGERLCAWDLGVRHGLSRSGSVERLSESGKVIERQAISRSGRVCLSRLAPGYTRVRLRVRRPSGDTRPAMRVHVSDRTRVLGVLRVESLD